MIEIAHELIHKGYGYEKHGSIYFDISRFKEYGRLSGVDLDKIRLGATVDLETVPLKYEGLRYDEIWISEAQERMIVAVPEEKWPELSELCASEGVEATVIALIMRGTMLARALFGGIVFLGRTISRKSEDPPEPPAMRGRLPDHGPRASDDPAPLGGASGEFSRDEPVPAHTPVP